LPPPDAKLSIYVALREVHQNMGVSDSINNLAIVCAAKSPLNGPQETLSPLIYRLL
jgi:hypothetical protein